MQRSQKTFSLAVVVLVAALLAPAALVGAQDAQVVIAEDLTGFYSFIAPAGTLADNGDGTYTLTLQDVPQYVPWVTSAPDFAAGRHELFYVAGSWAAAPESLAGKAVLETEGVSAALTLTKPVYDSELGTLTFTATIDDVQSAEESKEPAAPKSFETATLFVQLDYAFGTGFVAGAEARGADTRELGGGGHHSGGWPG